MMMLHDVTHVMRYHVIWCHMINIVVMSLDDVTLCHRGGEGHFSNFVIII